MYEDFVANSLNISLHVAGVTELRNPKSWKKRVAVKDLKGLKPR